MAQNISNLIPLFKNFMLSNLKIFSNKILPGVNKEQVYQSKCYFWLWYIYLHKEKCSENQ